MVIQKNEIQMTSVLRVNLGAFLVPGCAYLLDVRKKLEKIIQQCIDGELSSIELQEWMIFNYDPSEVKIGLGEAPHTVEAMNIVMNEYELARPDKFTKVGWKLALTFIACNQNNFDQTRNDFIDKGFQH